MIRSSCRFDGRNSDSVKTFKEEGMERLALPTALLWRSFSTHDPGNVSGNTAELVQTAFAIRSVFDRQHLNEKARHFMNPRALGWS